MKVHKIYFLFLAAVLIFLASTAYLMKDTKAKDKKISMYPNSAQVQDHSKVIKFDHKFHVKEAGAACKDCHSSALTSISAKDNLNPLHKDCKTCHDVDDQTKCSTCHIGIIYVKLEPTKKELVFSHQFHVGTQKQECTSCHIGIDQVKYASESPTEFPPMENCNTCHTNQTEPAVIKTSQAMMNCEGCHTNLTNLVPKNHRQSNFLNEHKVQFGVNAGSNNCMMCHSDNFCQVCHSPTSFKGDNTKTDFFAPYYSKEGATRTDRASLQKLTTVHNLNYGFTHGLDANNKSFECKTCHDPVTFCASCHQNGGETFTGVKPQSHYQPNFTIYGVNTGGGLHSTLAKKDIESCQSCHETEGADPVCVTCHMDNDGIKGTNPKTHDAGFMSDEKGIWHDTQGAICFTCHTDANAKPNGIKGVGFCGYCHPAATQDRRFR